MSLREKGPGWSHETGDSSRFMRGKQFSGPPSTENRRARSDSDTDPFNRPKMRHASSWTERRPDLSQLLPTYLIEEISEVEEPPSLANFEQKVTDHDTAGAKAVINELVLAETDAREKGRIVRSAAECAKRLSNIQLAIDLFEMGTTVDPASQASWIDRSKFLDELGEYTRAEDVLRIGIGHVQQSEQLARKLLKMYERSGNMREARAFLGEVARWGSADADSIFVEGALFELRQGRIELAMELLQMLKARKDWKANVYSELVQFFERAGELQAIAGIVEEGVKVSPRNALVCQALLKIQPDAQSMVKILRESRAKWTSEFTDKMVTTVCETLAARQSLGNVRSLMAEAIVQCSSRQRYKLLVTAATIEFVHSDPSLTPLILDFAVQVTPSKARPTVLILLAKVYEYSGEFDRALASYERVAREYSAEWRVFLELAQFHVHRSDIPSAIAALKQGLQQHPGSGRLWAFRVQLEAFVSLSSQVEVLVEAINAVPKSGEVWCEAARIALNPLSEYFNLEAANQYLEFAYRFTPQHGDTLIELVRVKILKEGPMADMTEIEKRFISSEGNNGMLYIFLRQMDDRPPRDVFRDAVREVAKDVHANRKAYARAMARSAFVVHSIQEETLRFQALRASGDLGSFAFGLTQLTRYMLDPSKCENKQQKLAVVMGPSVAGQ